MLTKRIRVKPPAEVVPFCEDSFAESSIGKLPRPRRKTGMPDMVPEPVSPKPAVVQLTNVEHPIIKDLILTVLQHGYPVDVTVKDVTVRIHPK